MNIDEQIEEEDSYNREHKFDPTKEFLKKEITYLIGEEERVVNQLRDIQKRLKSHQQVLWDLNFKFETAIPTQDESSN